MDTIRTISAFLVGLSFFPKLIVSAVIVFIAALFLALLWAKPAIQPIQNSSTSSTEIDIEDGVPELQSATLDTRTKYEWEDELKQKGGIFVTVSDREAQYGNMTTLQGRPKSTEDEMAKSMFNKRYKWTFVVKDVSLIENSSKPYVKVTSKPSQFEKNNELYNWPWYFDANSHYGKFDDVKVGDVMTAEAVFSKRYEFVKARLIEVISDPWSELPNPEDVEIDTRTFTELSSDQNNRGRNTVLNEVVGKSFKWELPHPGGWSDVYVGQRAVTLISPHFNLNVTQDLQNLGAQWLFDASEFQKYIDDGHNKSMIAHGLMSDSGMIVKAKILEFIP